jgi:hypothetical protein
MKSDPHGYLIDWANLHTEKKQKKEKKIGFLGDFSGCRSVDI